MKYTLAVLAAATSVAAQALDGVPECAQSCVPVKDGKINGKCNLLDTDCICGDNSFILDISCCVADGCGTQDEKDKVLEFANKICGVGNDLPDDIDATCQRSKEDGSGGDGGSAASRLGGAGFVGAIVAAAFAL